MGDPTTVDAEPCRLIALDEWTKWLGQDGTKSTPLEDGEACGFTGGDDSVRMAIGIVPYLASSAERFLRPDVRGAKQTMNNAAIVSEARWVEKYPVDQSSVLVVTTSRGFDLVVEMSTRGTRTQDDLRLGAIAFAESALGRLS